MSLDIRDLVVAFPTPAGDAVAVDGMTLSAAAGEVLGLVGESGSGKSVALRAVMRLIHPPARVTGSVTWQGRELLTAPPQDMRRVRGGEIAIIFQEPMSALNPVLPVGLQIDESLCAHTRLDRSGRRRRALELLDLVGIPEAARRLTDYPHQFSGGMRQRAMIAIALAASPKLLLADEPTTALDVTIQDQILKLILGLRDELGMSVVLVTHDLGVVAATCDRLAVMYAGRIVETGPVAEVLAHPRHAYTLGLLNSIPRAGTERRPLVSIEGSPPPLIALPPGCAFQPRCRMATEECAAPRPSLRPVGPGRSSACLHAAAIAAETGT